MKLGGLSKGGAATGVPGTYSAPTGKKGKVPRGKRDIAMPSSTSFRKSGRSFGRGR
jgi:hypothetical protein